MHDKMFHAPVTISVGLGFRREVASIAQMQAFLTEWSPSRRGPLYEMAMKACKMGWEGYITIEQARRSFVAFAEARGILWPDIDQSVSARAVARGYGGFAA